MMRQVLCCAFPVFFFFFFHFIPQPEEDSAVFIIPVFQRRKLGNRQIKDLPEVTQQRWQS